MEEDEGGWRRRRWRGRVRMAGWGADLRGLTDVQIWKEALKALYFIDRNDCLSNHGTIRTIVSLSLSSPVPLLFFAFFFFFLTYFKIFINIFVFPSLLGLFIIAPFSSLFSMRSKFFYYFFISPIIIIIFFPKK